MIPKEDAIRRRRRGEELLAAIRRAALDELVQGGYANLTVEGTRPWSWWDNSARTCSTGSAPRSWRSCAGEWCVAKSGRERSVHRIVDEVLIPLVLAPSRG